MPRRNRPSRASPSRASPSRASPRARAPSSGSSAPDHRALGPAAAGGWLRTETDRGGEGRWIVRSISGSAATKPYRCPGCDQEITAGTPHVVAWRADEPDGSTERRHWHTGCWRRRR